MSPILLTGATGHIGNHLIKVLAKKGYRVRALVRSREKAAGLPEEVERVVGDLARPATLSAALDGVDRVFLMDPSNGLDFTRNMVDASKQAGVRLIVDLSSLNAGLDPMPIMGRLFSDREAVIKDSGIAWPFLRPGQFSANICWWLAAIRDITDVARADGMAIITDDVERVTGQKPASFESWCWRNAAAFA